jgi:hypothetical protein
MGKAEGDKPTGAPVLTEQRTLYLTKNPVLVKKNVSLLLVLLLLGGLFSSGCARRTAQQKKTSWYKKHSGKSVPCPCGH